MTVIPKSQLSEISFPDCVIDYFEKSAFHLECKLDGIYIDSRGMVNAPVYITITNWKNASIERFDSSGANPIQLDLTDSGSLREICEWDVTNTKISFAGFERQSGQWQHYRFSYADIDVHIDE
tara:strand:- start:10387 stop:10755 length:369 start_codon:yes stop_codon:yes gene_type:complete